MYYFLGYRTLYEWYQINLVLRSNRIALTHNNGEVRNLNMDTYSIKPKSRLNDPLWCFLAEYPVSKLMPEHDQGDELAAGLLCQKMRDLGISEKWVEIIEMAFTRFAREALARYKPGGLKLPECIRVFYQKKMVGEKMNGGLSYFLIERTEETCESACLRPRHFVELYIYREGE